MLGSATPAVESYHRALQGEYGLVELPERVESRPLPEIDIVDMRRSSARCRTMFSTRLQEKLSDLVGTDHQAIILLNRRGFASFVLCRECGEVVGCPHCQVSLTYHKSSNRLKCHYCIRRFCPPMPSLCLPLPAPVWGGYRAAGGSAEQGVWAEHPAPGCGHYEAQRVPQCHPAPVR